MRRQYLPIFVAIFALVVVVTPYAIAESTHDGKKDHNKMFIHVDGFVGTITIPENIDKQTHKDLKKQVTVSLSDAARGLDVIKGNIGVAINENGEKFLVWSMVSMPDDNMTKTIYIVDAADATNTATITKHAKHKYSNGTGTYPDPKKIENKIEKLEQKFTKSTGNAELDELRTEFITTLKQLQSSIAEGNNTQADSLREQLKEIRNQMIDLRRSK